MELQAIESVISVKGFSNWSKSVLAHNEAKKAMLEIIQKRWKFFISKMTDEERHHIENFVQCMKAHNVKSFRTKQNLSCDHKFCPVLYERLFALYRSSKEMTGMNDNIPCLPASDVCFQCYWDMAMLFGDFDDDLTKSNVIELDISYLLRMMKNCRLFAFDDSSKVYDHIYNDRNELFHSSKNNVTDEQLHVILGNINTLLSNFEDPRFHVCNDVIYIIKQMKELDIQHEMTVYKHLVEKNLMAKAEALQKDMSTTETSNLKEALAHTKSLLLEIQESIQDEPDEISELQEENNKLQDENNKLKDEKNKLQEQMNKLQDEKNKLQEEKNKLQEEKNKLKDEKNKLQEEKNKLQEVKNKLQEVNNKLQEDNIKLQEKNSTLNERIKELEHERDDLQAMSNRKEKERKWIQLLEAENGEFIKDAHLIAKATEKGKEYLLLLEFLPSVILEKHKHAFVSQADVKADLSLVASLKELRTNFQAFYSQYWDEYYYNHHKGCYFDHWDTDADCDCKECTCWRCQYFLISKKYRICRRILKERCRLILSHPLIDLLIILIRQAVILEQNTVFMILKGHVVKLTEEFCQGITNVQERYSDLESRLKECENYLHYDEDRVQRCRQSIASVEKITIGLRQTKSFASGIPLSLAETEELFEYQDVDIVDITIASFADKWNTLKEICKAISTENL